MSLPFFKNVIKPFLRENFAVADITECRMNNLGIVPFYKNPSIHPRHLTFRLYNISLDVPEL